MSNQIDWSIDTRKRIFELIDKLFANTTNKNSILHFFKLETNSKNTKSNLLIEEFKELIELITNKNPYIYQPTINLQYQDVLVGGNGGSSDDGTIAQFDRWTNTIQILNKYIENVNNNPMYFAGLLDVIGHEQRHSRQYNFADEEELTNEHIADVTREFFEGVYPAEEIAELNEFIADNNLLERKFTKGQVSACRFGAYLSNACEVDARNAAYSYTKQMILGLINDEFCPEYLKLKLEKSLQTYEKECVKDENYNKKFINYFKRFRKRLKETVLKVLKKDPSQFSNEKYLSILRKCMLHISKDMTPKEKAEFVEWSVENNYTHLVQTMSFDASEADKEEILTCVQNLIKNNKITNENSKDLFIVSALQFKDVKEREIYLNKLMLSFIKEGEIKEIIRPLVELNGQFNFKEIMPELLSLVEKVCNNLNTENRELYAGLDSLFMSLRLIDLPVELQEQKEKAALDLQNKREEFWKLKNNISKVSI